VTEQETFVRAICEQPEDNVSRMVYADWLEDHGDPDRAEFIRDQIEWRPGSRDIDLLDANWDRWFPTVARHDERGFTRQTSGYGGLVVPLLSGNTVIFSRGFICEVRFSTAHSFRKHADDGYWGHQPVTAVTLCDKEPDNYPEAGTRHRWWLGGHTRAYLLDSDLYSLAVMTVNKGERYFATRADALRALSVACVLFGRERAGLSWDALPWQSWLEVTA
jgi:uncharacterized protein (TIGR02996 family)